MYQFAMAAITKHYKPCGFKQQKFTVLQSQGQNRGLGLRCQQGQLLLKDMKENLFHASPLTSGDLLAIFGISWHIETSLQSMSFSSHNILPVSLHSDFLFFSFFKDTSHVELGLHNNLTLTNTSITTLFLNKFTLCGLQPQYMNLGRTQLNP